MKKRKSYFIVLPKNRGILFASWNIDGPDINEKTNSEIDRDADLLIEIYSTENGSEKIIDTIPVHGLENNWHIFTKKEYFGKRIILALCCFDQDGKKTEIIRSKEIDIPLIEPDDLQDQESDKKELYNLSRTKLNDSSGPVNSSSW